MRYDQIYDRINSLCEERGWSQYKLIHESGIPQSSFYNMMDRHSIPQLDMIQRICDGFNITLAEFFADNDAEYEELSKDDLLFLHISRNLNADSTGFFNSKENVERLLFFLPLAVFETVVC